MFVKIFRQILDSSIADNAKVRRMFMDLLVLADQDGVVDMTHEAVARRIGVPLDEVVWAIGKLLEPDPADRSGKKNGARLEFVDPGRDWGWHIINYQHYRGLRDDESRRSYRRAYMRPYMQRKRESERKKTVNSSELTTGRNVTRCDRVQHGELTKVNKPDLASQNVNPCKPLLTSVNPKAEVEEEYKELSMVSQGETEKNGYGKPSLDEMKAWINSLFGRQAPWSYEETRLLSDLLVEGIPGNGACLSKQNRALISWAYKLPRDADGWVLVNGRRSSKRKENVLTLLRDFSSEIDKWKGWRRPVASPRPPVEPLSAEWIGLLKKIYGDEVPIPHYKSLLAPSVIAEVEAQLKKGGDQGAIKNAA